MKNLQRQFALFMAITMGLASITGCSKKPQTDPSGVTGQPSSTDEKGTEPVPEVKADYTYNTSVSTFPTNWSPFDEKTSTDADLMDYCVAGFYGFDYDESKEGYQLLPKAAKAEPVDVTKDYVGKFGVKEGDSAKAYKITLRDDLKWDDGTPIKAADFVKSAELLLNPKAQHYRADMLYQGNLVIYNSKNYLYQGQHAYSTYMIDPETYEGYVDRSDLTVNADGYYELDGKDLAMKMDDGAAMGDSLQAFVDAGYLDEANTKIYEEKIAAKADENGVVKITPEIADALDNMLAVIHGYKDAAERAQGDDGDYAYQEFEEFLFLGEDYAEMDFSEVGMFADGDYDLVIVLDKPLSGFYLLYSLTDSWLVKEDLFKSCESEKDGVYTCTYGTSADTFASFGPYKLTSFQADKQYVLEKNENYFGLTADTYQTTKIQVDYVPEAATALEMFLNGQLDTYGLSANDMETYQTSDFTYYATSESTFFVAVNPDLAGLKEAEKKVGEGYNKTILTVKEFRQALSFALDRNAFALAASPTNSAAFGVFSSQIIADPEKGTSYRSTEEAKQVLVDFWGLSDEVGDGKMYATVDDAVESITGYNPDLAKKKFDEAYDIAIKDGLLTEDQKISITVGVPDSSSPFYSKGYDFLVNNYTNAVKGTKLEGKLEFNMDDTIGNGFAESLQSNQVNMLFGVGWSGSALDPYGLMEAYTSKNYQYDPSWDTTTATLDVTLSDGKTYTGTVWDWTLAISGEEIEVTDQDGNKSTFKAGSSDDNAQDRFEVLVALEGAVLDTYDLIPLLDDSSANLRGMQINYYTEEYNFAMGFGGVKYYTYNYTDEQWDEYVKAQGGTLNYK